MRIVEVRLFRIEGEGPAWAFDDRAVEALDVYPDHVRATAGAGEAPAHLRATYMEIATDEGVTGLYGPIDERQAFLIATDLRPRLVGADPLAIEQLHDRILRLHRHGRAGLFVNAISAIDNALWDLRGKALGEPVYRLLGGPTRERVPVYASMLGCAVEPERAATVAAEHAAMGYGAQKWFFAYGPGAGADGLRRNLAMARAVREAVGDGYPLMFDAFIGWDATYAADMLRGLEPVEPHWVEEPVPPERLDVFRRLASSTRLRLATGEHAHTRWQSAAARRGRRRIQADPDWAGRHHRAAAHLLALLLVRRPGRLARPCRRGAAARRRVAIAADGPDDRVPRDRPGAEPVLPRDHPPAGRGRVLAADRARPRDRSRRVEDGRLTRARVRRLSAGATGGQPARLWYRSHKSGGRGRTAARRRRSGRCPRKERDG